jgi:hypothetical protein
MNNGNRQAFVSLASVLAAAVILTAVGCGTASQHVAPITDVDGRLAATEQGDFDAIIAEAEAAWQNRSDTAALEQAIASWEHALRVEVDGDRRAALYPVLHQLSRAYYFLGDGHYRFLETPDRDARMLAAFEQGVEYGRLAAAVNNDAWNRELMRETPIPQAVSVLNESDIPALYWYSTNLGKWAVMDGIATILAHKDDIAAIMQRIADLDRGWGYGASDRYFGVFYTKIPMGNPDLARSYEHFMAAISAEPNYLSARVLLAEEYAPKVQDRELFVTQLEYVLNADLDALPEYRPENEVEQEKARRLMARIDELFR